MPKIYTITLSDAEDKALNYVAISAQDWIENAVRVRTQNAIEEIFQMEVARMSTDPTIESIPANKELVVLAADILPAAVRYTENTNQ